MGKVLVEASKVTCGAAAPHQGTVSMTGSERLVIGGSKVLTTTSVAKASVLTTASELAVKSSAPCTNPGNAGGPCTKVEPPMTGGASTRLKVDGVFVVLDSLQAMTDRASAIKVDSESINNDLLKAD